MEKEYVVENETPKRKDYVYTVCYLQSLDPLLADFPAALSGTTDFYQFNERDLRNLAFVQEMCDCTNS